MSDSAYIESALPDGFSGVVVLRNGRGEKTYLTRGCAHRPTQTRIRETTRFGIASGTKGFTSCAILEAIDRGMFSLETRLDELLPGMFPGFSGDITIEHLLTHTSGIPDYCDEEAGCDFEALWLDRPVYTMRRITDFVPMFRDAPMKFAPGTRFSYSNSGFLVLGLVMETVSGRPYTTYIETEIFDRAGMESSGFFSADALPQDTAVGYIREGEVYRSNVFSIPIVGSADGGAYSTADDMLRFWDHLFQTGTLSGALGRRMLDTRVPTNQGGGLDYSLGFWRADEYDTPVFVLIGSDPGVSFYSAYQPDSGKTFAVLCNSDDGAWPLVSPLRTLLYEGGNES